METECGRLRILSECLGSSSMRLGVLFYSPKAARSRWRPTRKAILAFCRVAHRTVRCTIGQPLFMSGARSPSYYGVDDRCRFIEVGAPDTVRCPLPTVGAGREICYFATLNFGCLLLCHPVSMTGGTVCVYDLWVRWHIGEAHK
jgi:hypothetical protein